MHKRPLNWIQWMTLIVTGTVCVLLPLILIRLSNEQSSQTHVLRTLVCFFEGKALASPQLTLAQKHQAIIIYNEALAAIRAEPCST
jgi:hypothetical protein